MSERSIFIFRPGLELLEAKQLLSVRAAASPLPHKAAQQAPASQLASATEAQAAVSSQAASSGTISATAVKPNFGFLVFRVTNPTKFNDTLVPPFPQVLVQQNQPVPGQVYNVLFITIRNGTAQTFNASSGFTVKFPGQKTATPILTGNETWQPGQVFVFYVLTKQYYPMPNQVHTGFEYDLGGARSIGIPGPSGIALRIKYNPATFARTLNSIVAFGKGAQGGVGVKFGMPDTAIDEFVAAKTQRNDFGGYF